MVSSAPASRHHNQETTCDAEWVSRALSSGLWERMEGFLAQNISLGVCVGGEADLALPAHPPQPNSVIEPCSGCQSLAQQRQCSTPNPGAPNPAPEWPNYRESHLGERPSKAKGCLRPNMQQAHFLTLLPPGISIS